MKIDARAAVMAAKKYFNDIQELIGNIQDILLEELELSEDKKFWLITLGFNRPKINI